MSTTSDTAAGPTNKWNSRKLAVAFGVAALSTVLLVLGYIQEETWAQIISVTLIAYLPAQAYIDKRK